MPAPTSHTRRYSAFISYRHADNTQEGRRWAEWLHRALERYAVPPDLIGTPNLRGEPIRDSLYPIFRDEDELPANADLATGILAALERSDHLIVLCSPRSAVSPWVRKEVREFKKLGRSDRILAVIIAGEPNADDPAKAREGILRDEECFCEELRFGALRDDGTLDWNIRTEPLAADLRPVGTRAEGFVTAEAYREYLTLNSSLTTDRIDARTESYRQQLDKALLKITTGILGVPLSQLIDRDAAFRAKLAEQEADRLRQIAEKERQLAEEAGLARAKAEYSASRMRYAMVATAMLAITSAIMAFYGWHQAEAARNAEAISNQANKKNLQTLHEASKADYAVAVERFEKDNKWSDGLAHLARSLEWEPSNKYATSRLFSSLALYATERQSWPRTILQHRAAVNTAQFSSDSSRIVTTCLDNTARIWDVLTGKQVGAPLHHADSVWTAQFSADGKKIITASSDGTAQIWETLTGNSLGTPLRHSDAVNSAQFSPDGRRAITARSDKSARIWDAFSGGSIGPPLQHQDIVWSAQFNQDGSRIVTASFDHTAQIWDASTYKPTGEALRHTDRVWSAQFSPDGTRIVTSSADGTARVWDALTCKSIGEPLQHDAGVNSAQFSPDGTRVVTASSDKTARIWDPLTGKPSSAPLVHADGVNSAQFSADGRYVVTACGDFLRNRGYVRIWKTEDGQPIGEELRHDDNATSAQFNSNGMQILSASSDGTARIWDAASDIPVGEPLLPKDIKRFAASASRQKLASTNCVSQLLRNSDSRSMFELMPHKSQMLCAQYSADGKQLATSSEDWNTRIWNTEKGILLCKPLKQGDNVICVQFSDDGKRLLTVCRRSAQIWDTLTGMPIGDRLISDKNLESAQFDSNCKAVITISSANTGKRWDTQHILHPPVPIPEWMIERIRAVSGIEFDSDGEAKAIPAMHRLSILMAPPPGDDGNPWCKLARWLSQPANQRNFTPYSEFTRRQLAERERDFGQATSIDAALSYDPSVPLAHVLLAKFEQNPQRADFLRRYGLKLLPDDATLWARAAMSLVEQLDFKSAQTAAERALMLDASNASARKALADAIEGARSK